MQQSATYKLEKMLRRR